MPTTSTILRTAGALTVAGLFAACSPNGADVVADAGAAPAEAPVAAAAAAGTAPAKPTASTKAPGPRSSSATSTAPAPVRPVYCGTITGVDPQRGRLTFRTEMSYRVAGDIWDARPESKTLTLPVRRDAEVVEFIRPKGRHKVWEGNGASLLRTVESLSLGDKKPYVTLDNGTITKVTFGVNTGAPSTPKCFDDR